MHLYRRGSMWWIYYEVGGVRHRKSTGTTDIKEAKRWMKNIDTARNMPTLESAIEVLKTLFGADDKPGLDLSSAWDVYTKMAAALGKLELSERTITARRYAVRSFVTWTGENAATVGTVEKVSGPVAAKYCEHLAKEGKSGKTRCNIIGNLSTVWEVLAKTSADIHNPWKSLAPSATSERIPAFTPDEEKRVLEAARKIGKDWYTISVIARHTGLRYGDIATMMWSHVDIANRVIVRTPSKTERYDIKLRIPMVEEVCVAVSELKRTGDYLFPLHAEHYGKRGKSVQRLINYREVLTLAGLGDEYTFHSWRHTAASRLAEAGASKDTRKLILGHTTDENSDRYDHSEHLAEQRLALEAAAKVTSCR